MKTHRHPSTAPELRLPKPNPKPNCLDEQEIVNPSDEKESFCTALDSLSADWMELN